MNEEKKQHRADNCTPEDFAKEINILLEKTYELYSIASRVTEKRLREFANAATDNFPHPVWAQLRTAETYMNKLNLDIQDAEQAGRAFMRNSRKIEKP